MASIEVVSAADAATLARFDALIDARSPGEFALDHVPGAVNLPVLSDAERAEVGTIYVQEDRFRARRVGAAYVARNIARHLETALADKPGSFRPLVYCWRGGMRSNAMATILAQVGWRASVLAGGYRAYRRGVTARLYDAELELAAVLLDGPTGTGKTAVLHRLGELGVQTLDLEGLAAHRGSLFGHLPDRPQPSQKMFESRLLAAIDALDLTRPVVVEAESSKIGERMVPPTLWKAMAGAPRIELYAAPPARARFLAETYREVAADRAGLETAFRRLPTYPGRKRLEDWAQMIDDGAWRELALALIEQHYDPAYRRSSGKHEHPLLGRIDLGEIGPAEIARAAEAIARLVQPAGANRARRKRTSEAGR
jgi:tRNA 2-selenouridine synthase